MTDALTTYPRVVVRTGKHAGRTGLLLGRESTQTGFGNDRVCYVVALVATPRGAARRVRVVDVAHA